MVSVSKEKRKMFADDSAEQLVLVGKEYYHDQLCYDIAHKLIRAIALLFLS
jgi:hypothetical protein